MSEIKILVEGYAKANQASPTSTLIRDSGKIIVVDPGASKVKLLEALKRENVEVSDVDLIFLTHYHLDHVLNIRLFGDIDIYDGSTIWRDDQEIDYSGGKIPGTEVEIIPTPGHANEHVSLLVDTKDGKICVAGDIWWWMDDMPQETDYQSLLSHKDPYVKDEKKLIESRKKILEIADFIIPGHGKMFKVDHKNQ